MNQVESITTWSFRVWSDFSLLTFGKYILVRFIQTLGNYLAVILCSPLFYSFWLSLKFIYAKFGLFQSIIATIFAPVTIILVPIYMGLFEGKWTAAVSAYSALV